jgi:hypothetical protein
MSASVLVPRVLDDPFPLVNAIQEAVTDSEGRLDDTAAHKIWADVVADYGAEASDEVKQLREALRMAEQFIQNGVEFGFINMPATKTDPAYRTLPAIQAALGSEPA